MRKLIWLLIIVGLISGLTYLLHQELNFNQLGNEIPAIETANIVVAAPPAALNPYSIRAFDQQYLEPIYQSLIRADEQLQFQPGLAFTYGQIDPQTWQFTLRDNVLFHDGQTLLTPKTVTANFDFITTNSQLLQPQQQEQLNNISQITTTEDTIQFKLTDPDPEFLQLISKIPLLPIENYEYGELLDQPIGTGPFQYLEQVNNTYSYHKFPSYWGPDAFANRLNIIAESDSIVRSKIHTEQNDVLAVVPYPIDIPNYLREYEVQTQPDLTAYFFIWNDFDPVWDNRDARLAFRNAFPYEKITQFTSELGQPASQFISSGVFGFNPQISVPRGDLNERTLVISQAGLKDQVLRFAFPPSLESFGLAIERDLNNAGLAAEAYAIDESQLFDPFYLEGIHLILIGWQNTNATSTSFLNNFLLTDSEFNLSSYQNSAVTKMLSELQTLTLESERLKTLQSIMLTITEQDPFGVPLFYGQRAYLLHKDYNLPVRLDGVVLVY